MRKLLFVLLFFMTVAVSKYVYCQDNLLAVDVITSKHETPAKADKSPASEENASKAQLPMEEEPKTADDPEQDLKRIKAYREFLENKQKELEIIRLDLEKSNLLLKKKEAEKEIFEIDKALPQGKKGFSETSSLLEEAKETAVDASDIKILLLLISDDLKEGIITLKGTPYSFREGDSIASKLTVEQIESSGITFRQPDESVLKLNFIN